jgi:hypothetical protein
MSSQRDAAGIRCRGGVWRARSRACVAVRQVVATHGVAEVEPVWPQDEVAAAAHRVDEPRERVTGRTAGASATDRREVEQRDGASGCMA